MSLPPFGTRSVSRRQVLLAAAGMCVLGGVALAPSPGSEQSVEPAGAAGSAGREPLAGGALDAFPEVTMPVSASVALPVSMPSQGRPALLTSSVRSRAVSRPVVVRDTRSLRPMHPGVETHVSTGGRDLVLSIDDGPSVPYTHEILALLRKHDVRATFCMVGRQVAAYPDIAKAVAADGHQLANHTWSHAWLPDLSHRAMVREIDRAQEALDKVTGGVPARVFRAPFGAWSKPLVDLCWQRRMRALGWSVDPRDWARPPTGQIVSDVLHHAAPGRIVLDHDGGGDRSHTVAAIKAYLPRLLHLGYRFVLP
jgi:peptidoglycan/xylan/chitin deacetylase (PgdA/CDA1 family)